MESIYKLFTNLSLYHLPNYKYIKNYSNTKTQKIKPIQIN